jgi:F-type H+-transporting ATPase subunit delta
MALTRSTARRYAEAAFEIAERDDSMEAWLAAFTVAEERLADPDAARLLANPSLPLSARQEVLVRILGEDVTGAPRSLLGLLIRRGRFDLLPAIAREFRRLHARREGILEATLTSAAPLDEGECAAVEARLVALTGSRIDLSAEVDPELLGGIQVQLGDQLIDGSVRGRLERMRATLSNT